MHVPDGDVDDLAKGLIKDHPSDALDWAALMSNMLFLLGHADKSKKWMLVRASIEKIQAGRR